MTNGRGGSAPRLSSPPIDPDVAGDPPDLARAKAAAREAARARRAAVSADLRPRAADAVAGRVLEAVDPSAGTVVSVYLSFRDELDTAPLLAALHARGCVTCAPVVGRVGQPLSFRRWWPGVPLETERFGTVRPAAAAGEVVPAVLVVPMLAFDRAGRRMGYGAGFYDRTLAGLRAAGPVLAVGIAFAAQEVDALPAGPHDQPLDRIVTEAETFEPGRTPTGVPGADARTTA